MRQNGVCVPQREYCDLPTNQNLVFLIRRDVSFIPVVTGLEGESSGWISRDIPGLDEAGLVIAFELQFEVNRPNHPLTPILIDCVVFGMPASSLTGESTNVVESGGG